LQQTIEIENTTSLTDSLQLMQIFLKDECTEEETCEQEKALQENKITAA